MFLRLIDYTRQIKEDKLQQAISNDPALLDTAESEAIKEMSSYLRQRFDVEKIFIQIKTYTSASVFAIGDLINLEADDYSNTATYSVGALVQYGKTDTFYGYVWKKLTTAAAGTVPVEGINWTKIGDQNGLYSCVAVNTAGEALENNVKFTKGDTRDAQILMYCVDISLYHTHSRVAPRAIPSIRAVRYDGNTPSQTGGAIGWLKGVAKGAITPDLPLIDPEQGGSIRWGSRTKLCQGDY